MKKGYLSQYFDGVAVKILSAVEADVLTSNQHSITQNPQLTICQLGRGLPKIN